MVDVQAHEIHEAERSDAKAGGVDQDAVDGGEVGDAFGKDAQRFRHEGAAGMVDDEAGRVLAADRRVAEALRELGERIGHPALGEHAVDHLDDLHHRHRVEEVITRHASGALAGGGHRSDGEGRGIARQDARVVHDRFELGEERALGAQVLDDRLDHQVAGRERPEPRHHLDAAGDRLRVRDAPFLGEPGERLRDRVEAALRGAGLRVVDERAHARLREHLRDAAAHGAAAGDAGH